MSNHKIEVETPEGTAYGRDLVRRLISECVENDVCPVLMVQALGETIGAIVAHGVPPAQQAALLLCAGQSISAAFRNQLQLLARQQSEQPSGDPVKQPTHEAPTRQQ